MGVQVGVLALQGAVEAHIEAFADLGVDASRVRDTDTLAHVDALVIPGGESTTMSMLLEQTGLRDALVKKKNEGLPIFGTCAGMILCAHAILDGRVDQEPLDAIDIVVRRNAFGRQVDSFECGLNVEGFQSPFPAVFIRAPIAEEVGESVEVLARVNGHPVLCRNKTTLVSSFHPELSTDRRIHQLFLDFIAST